MRLIVITSPDSVGNEIQIIISLFENGVEVLHLRKPDWDINKYEEFIKEIPFAYYKRLVLHSHYKLGEKYNIKGIHLTSDYRKGIEVNQVKELIRIASKRNLTVSTSFHSIEEVDQNILKFKYVFLSPVFDSISKVGYKTTFNKKEILEFLSNYTKSTEVVALGGIEYTNINEVKEMGFSNAAILGAIWNNKGSEVESYKKIKLAIGNE